MVALPVTPDTTLGELRAAAAALLPSGGGGSALASFTVNGRPLAGPDGDAQTLAAQGVQHDDMVLVSFRAAGSGSGSGAGGAGGLAALPASLLPAQLLRPRKAAGAGGAGGAGAATTAAARAGGPAPRIDPALYPSLKLEDLPGDLDPAVLHAILQVNAGIMAEVRRLHTDPAR